MDAERLGLRVHFTLSECLPAVEVPIYAVFEHLVEVTFAMVRRQGRISASTVRLPHVLAGSDRWSRTAHVL